MFKFTKLLLVAGLLVAVFGMASASDAEAGGHGWYGGWYGGHCYTYPTYSYYAPTYYYPTYRTYYATPYYGGCWW